MALLIPVIIVVVVYLVFKLFYPLFVGLYMKFLYGEIVYVYFSLKGFFGQIAESQKKHDDSYRIISEIYNKNPKTKLIVFNYLGRPLIYFLDQEMMKFLSTNHQYFEKVYQKFADCKKYSNGGLFLSQGEQWSKWRKISSQFFRFDEIKKMIPTIVDTCMETYKKIDSTNPLMTVTMCKEITSEVTAKTFFSQSFSGYKCNGRLPLVEVKECVDELYEYQKNSMVFALKITILGLEKHADYLTNNEKKKLKRVEIFRDFFIQRIEERVELRKNTGNKLNDLLDVYIDIILKNEATVDDIFRQFLNFYLAGMDTTGNASAVGLSMLGKYPEVKAKLVEEINTYIKDVSDITYQNIQKMNYLNCFYKECLRLYPPSPGLFLRFICQDLNICGVNVKKGWLTNMGILVNHRKEEYYKDPYSFNPDRWLEKNNEQDQEEDFHFMPYGIGARNCLGQHLANIEMKVILITFLKQFDPVQNEKQKFIYGTRFLMQPYYEDTIYAKKRE